jgi:hypothetical protein
MIKLSELIAEAKKWAECPRATQDLEYNTMNRDYSIKTDNFIIFPK